MNCHGDTTEHSPSCAVKYYCILSLMVCHFVWFARCVNTDILYMAYVYDISSVM